MFIKCLLVHMFLFLNNAGSISSLKPKLTLDEFFNYTQITFIAIAPDNGQSILIQTVHHIWEAGVNEEHLYLQSFNGEKKVLISASASPVLKPRWYGEWIAYVDVNRSDISNDDQQYYVRLFSSLTGQRVSLSVGKTPLHTFAWSNTGTALYYATTTSWTNETEIEYKDKWKGVIQHREKERGDTIYRIDFENPAEIQINVVMNISLGVAELICSPDGKYLVYSTESRNGQIESIEDFEIYSLNLANQYPSVPFRLTNNQAIERKLTWFKDESMLFTVSSEGSLEGDYKDSQGRLYSINLTNGHIDRWATQFTGSVTEFALLKDDVVILGQMNTEVGVYTQQSPKHGLIKQTGWRGTYEKITIASAGNASKIAFIYSSFDAPQEIYSIDRIDRLTAAEQVTNLNRLFIERNLPKGASYRWRNDDDGVEIEGVLLYPPDKFEQKNLPLLVLIHGGPYRASLNAFYISWYYSAVMMATEGWLVLQPNYRGSTGYGDDFLNGVVLEMVSRPGKDILFGVDALIKAGIADPTRLTIGGYSYGGYLTNWLITQTTRFNAALSGAGAVDHVVDWGTNDMPLSNSYSLGGYPWQATDRYRQEAAIFRIDKVRTPTHIVTGEYDVRVPVAQNYMFERALHTLGVPNTLIIFPGEGHVIRNNPWHEKIKVREELSWLQKYGYTCLAPCNTTLSSYAIDQPIYFNVFSIIISGVFIQSLKEYA